MPLYHKKFSSDCVYLDIGCYVKYFDNTAWQNADTHPNVVSGKFSDGSYCYTIENGIVTQKYSTFVTLNVHYNRSFSRYDAIIYTPTSDPAIAPTIVISESSLAVTGFTDGACSVTSGETDTAVNNLIIPDGDYIGQVNANIGFTVNTEYYKFDGYLVVNDTPRYDGETFMIGSTEVTIFYAQNCYTLVGI